MKRLLFAALTMMALTVAACGDDDGPTNGNGNVGVATTLALVSGDGQRVAVGGETIEPFLVKVTDGAGNAVRNVVVTWAVTAGGGSVSSTSTSTDGFGMTSVVLTAGSAEGENTVTGSVDGLTGSPATFSATALAPASISIVGGDGQMARTLQPLAEPFQVLVRASDNSPLPGAMISWTVTVGGGGTLFPAAAPTDVDGIGSTLLTLGTFAVGYTITAGVSGSTLMESFSALATSPETVVVNMQNIAFIAPGGGQDVTILLGDRVQWINLDQVQHTATSTAEPPGGNAFDSGLMNNGVTFTFTANVRGQWTYHCEVHPAQMTGALIIVQ